MAAIAAVWDSTLLANPARSGAAGRAFPASQRLGTSLDTDSTLVERCLNGEEAAWEDLVRVHTRRVYAICYRFTGSGSDAQDITQDVFLRVFQSLKSYRSGEGSFQVWLARLTRNLLIDNYRRGKMQRLSDPIEDQLPRLEESAHSVRADARLEGREASEHLQHALQKLSPELREAVVLRDLEELEYKEIAQVLKVPEGTVKSRINRGRAELARVLRKQKAIV
ncbi:MAG: sigma-70 family RNA polymerase sigma factor [Acidimicrobiia bacterium]|nr:sigma-70 family RNA polymerase sigma factor [Acidimicrobiia bacterium]